MEFLKVKGSYYEMGFQQGEYFCKDIKTSFERLIKSKAIKSIKPKLFPNFVFSKLLKYVIYKKWKKPIEILIPDYSNRIKGIADGADVDVGELYVIQSIEVMADDVRYFLKNNTNFTPLGCSSICILPKMTYNNELILGKNFDYLSEFLTDQIVRISQPKEGYKSIEITYKQIAGCHDGMNEKGLVVLYNYGLTIEKVQTRIPITILVQQLLERCANIEEAIMFIKSFRYPNGAILTLADASNRTVCVEITPEHIGFRKPSDGVVVATNFYISEEVKKYDIPHNAYFKKWGLPKELQNKRVHQSNELRYLRILQMLKEKHKVSLEDIEEILKDHSNKNSGDDDTICRHGELLSTQASIIFLPKSKKIKVCFGQPCKNKYTEFSLD
ncbi:MAG: C45 family peptidase [Elusimicrobiota bacterium]|nr:C45 family peptidase [Endomicrobiia bacterium]MDW8165010.1 C45 family peptidase [Elusimicrobiota bacterium]